MRLIATVVLVLVVVVAGGVAFLEWSSAEPPIAAIAPPAAASFPKDQVRKGAELAALGTCDTCHTADHGRTFAGGRPLHTPFGVIYGSNITPDPDTGIGRWSAAAFLRALHDGVDRDGHQLYPAFPYDHFTRMSDDDGRAIYAYLMTRDPVRATPPPNKLEFPLNFRPLVAAWKLLYFTAGRFRGQPGRNPELNRGAYLVEAVAHCGACHTPRNMLGAEERGQTLAGGWSEGWMAPALTAASPAPVPWTVAQLYAYLRTGHDRLHGASGGPMAEVTQDLAQVDDADAHAIAASIGSRMGAPSPERQQRAKDLISALPRAPTPVPGGSRGTVGAGETRGAGQTIYDSACAGCHATAGAGLAEGLNLSLSTAVRLPRPNNFLNVVLHGIHPPPGQRGAIMPPFAATLSDRQIAEVANFVRTRIGRRSPWRDVNGMAGRLRGGETTP